MITISLNEIEKCLPCTSGWEKLLKHLGKTQADDVRFPLSVVLDSNGIEDALWCCRCLPQYNREWRLFAVWCARQVQHLMPDNRSIDALDVAERYANGQATDEELAAASAAAYAASYAADAAAYAVARAAAYAATYTAAYAAYAAPAAADAAAYAATYTADYAAYAAAYAVARESQSVKLLRVCDETEDRAEGGAE